jgi:hypothetical protein
VGGLSHDVGRRRLSGTAEAFDVFWAAYPRKRKRLDAKKAFEQARREGVTLETMLSALSWQRSQPQWTKDGGQFIPYPASWLRAGSYDDEPDEPIAVPVKEHWYEVCQREHGGTCEKQWAHAMKMREAS